MGGGSSDAAALLVYLNSLLPRPMEKEELVRIAMKVGCDVPFFVCGTRAAVVTGLGEIVEPVAARDDLEGFVIMENGAIPLNGPNRRPPTGSSQSNSRPNA